MSRECLPQTQEDVAKLLNITLGKMRFLLARYQEQYTKFTPRRKQRTFYNPGVELRVVQTQIKKWLDTYALPANVDGWRRRRSAKNTAEAHIDKFLLITIDIKDFFPSVSHSRVKRMFVRMGCGEDAAAILAKFTTMDGHLPQGFITSPGIANLLLKPFDYKLLKLCNKSKAIVRRFGDDITISCDREIPALVSSARNLIHSYGFRVNEKKFSEIGLQYHHDNQKVLGLSVKNRVAIPLRRFGAYKTYVSSKDAKVAKTRGYISYVRSMNEEQALELAEASKFAS